NQHAVRNARNEVVCVEARDHPRLSPPTLREPTDGSVVVGTAKLLVIAPAWADAIHFEVCADLRCQGLRLSTGDSPVIQGQASFSIPTPPVGQQLYWRATGRSKGEVMGPPSEIHVFTCASPQKASDNKELTSPQEADDNEGRTLPRKANDNEGWTSPQK